MGTPIEAKEMADGILVPILCVAHVVSGGGVKVAVARVGVHALQLGHPFPPLARQGWQGRSQPLGGLRD